MPISVESIALSAADAVWIATALLQRESPEVVFSIQQIVDRVALEHLTDVAEGTVRQHVSQHCVASMKAQPNKLRMLTAHGRGERSLFRDGDPVDASRAEGRKYPAAQDIPARFHDLLEWYENEWNVRQAAKDTLLAAAGTGRGIWKIDAVSYIRQLRDDDPEGAQ